MVFLIKLNGDYSPTKRKQLGVTVRNDSERLKGENGDGDRLWVRYESVCLHVCDVSV
ncbi:hypothetical protein VPHD292_0092 [Vibrio phage D292]